LNKAILHKSIDLLSRREHSVQELQNKLRLREFQPDDITEVIDFLIVEDYISESRFADCIFRTRISKGYGKRFIVNELGQKGLTQRDIALAAENVDVNWYHQAEEVYNKRFKEVNITDNKDKAKRIRFMQYRGFSSDEILTVMNVNENNEH
jgi:regulatory protein